MSESLPHKTADAIRADYIDNCSLSVGDKMPTVRDLAKHYKVSSATAANALSVLEAQGLIEKRQGSGSYVAQRLVLPYKAPKMAGFIAANTTDLELVMRAYQGVETVFQSNGYNVITAISGYDYDTERLQVERLINAGCEAIILYPTLRTSAQLKSDYIANEFTDFCIVLIDSVWPEMNRPLVVFDNVQAGFDVTASLIRNGHRSIAFMDSSGSAKDCLNPATIQRHNGYVEAFKAANIEPDPINCWFVQCEYNNACSDVWYYLQEWTKLPEGRRPTALIGLDDTAAMHTICLASELGIKVPDDLQVVGFDNLIAGRSFRPGFPTTNPDFLCAGEIAAQLAIRYIKGELKGIIEHMLPVPVIDRNNLRTDE